MRLRTHCLWIWLGITTAGCELLHPPTAVRLEERSVVVHAVLAAGSDRAAVLLTRVGPAEPFVPGQTYPFEPGIDAISGAEVRLLAGADTIRLVERAPGFRSCLGVPTADAGPGCYAAHVPGGIRSGERYRLQIRLREGRTIEGEAVPPPPPVLLAPEPHAGLPVRFHAPAGVAGVGLVVGGPMIAFLDGAPAPHVECRIETRTAVFAAEWTDSASVALHSFHCVEPGVSQHRAVRPDSVHARLYVTAYDAAFLRYRTLLHEKQVDPALAAQGVSGALGLFAGEATVERPITLVVVDR